MVLRIRCVKIIHSFEEEMISDGCLLTLLVIIFLCNLDNILFVFQQAENFASEHLCHFKLKTL